MESRDRPGTVMSTGTGTLLKKIENKTEMSSKMFGICQRNSVIKKETANFYLFKFQKRLMKNILNLFEHFLRSKISRYCLLFWLPAKLPTQKKSNIWKIQRWKTRFLKTVTMKKDMKSWPFRVKSSTQSNQSEIIIRFGLILSFTVSGFWTNVGNPKPGWTSNSVTHFNTLENILKNWRGIPTDKDV